MSDVDGVVNIVSIHGRKKYGKNGNENKKKRKQKGNENEKKRKQKGNDKDKSKKQNEKITVAMALGAARLSLRIATTDASRCRGGHVRDPINIMPRDSGV